MSKKNTYTLAYEACETYFVETGQMPTIDKIKAIIGINTPTIISSAIKDWKASLSQTVRNGQTPKPGVPSILNDAIADIWEQALSEANAAVNGKIAVLQTKQAALEEQEAALYAERDRVQQMLAFSEQKFQEEITYLKNENTRLMSEASTLTEQTECFRALATQAEKNNAVLTEAIHQEKDKLQRLEVQYDKEHNWALKRIEEEKDRHRKQTQNEMNRLQSETNRSKQAQEIFQAKVELMEKQATENRDRIIELERNLSDEKLKLAELTLNEAKLQNEINAKDELIRIFSNKKNKK